MFNIKARTTGAFMALAILAGASASADTLTLLTSPSAQQATDYLLWTQVGPDNTLLNASRTVKTVKGLTTQVAFGTPNGVISVACSANPCSWTGHGFTAGESLVWTSDAGNGGSGPVSVTFPYGMVGVGAYIQPDGPGVFTAVAQVYNGSTLLGSVSVTGNSAGDATYLGVRDQQGERITKVVWSLSSAAQGPATDFAIGTLLIQGGIAVVNFSPTSLTFASQTVGTTSSAQPVTLKNTGTATLNIKSTKVSGDFSLSSKTCGATLGSGASCTFNINFTPKATGTRTGSLTLSDNAAPGTQSLPLTGTGK